MKPYKRSERVKEEVKRIIAETITFEAKDPLLRRVTILRVEMTDDLRFARIYYTSMEKVEDIQTRLEHAKGFLRSSLAKKLRMKYTPEISFHEVKDLPWETNGWVSESQ